MKFCGLFLRVLAVMTAIVLCVVVIWNGSLQLESIDESRDELAESIDEHEEEIRNRYTDSYYSDYNDVDTHDESECSTCEYHEERERALDRSEKSLFLSVIQALMIYAVLFGGMLFALGAILSRTSCAKPSNVAPVAAPAPVAQPVVIPTPVSNVCPNCGAPKQPGVRFCGTCGTPSNCR